MTGRVYFLECAGRIKIGYSHDVEERRRELSTSAPAPLALLGQVPGCRKDEQSLHAYLAVFRANGEWFIDCDTVRCCIASVLEDAPKAIKKIKKALEAKRHPELRAALAKIADPCTRDERMPDIICRAAAKAGLPYWRTFDIWYGKARRVEIAEALKIQQALIATVGLREMARQAGGKDRA